MIDMIQSRYRHLTPPAKPFLTLQLQFYIFIGITSTAFILAHSSTMFNGACANSIVILPLLYPSYRFFAVILIPFSTFFLVLKR